MGAGTQRHLWRWTCYRVADSALNAVPLNRYEAALYGALGSHVRAVLPVCAGWEDEAWTYCRAWMDLAAEAAVPAQAGTVALNVPSDQVASWVASLAESSGVSRGRDAGALALEAMAVGTGAWPLPHLSVDDVGRRLLPRSFAELGALLASSTNPATRTAVTSKQHILQVCGGLWSRMSMVLGCGVDEICTWHRFLCSILIVKQSILSNSI